MAIRQRAEPSPKIRHRLRKIVAGENRSLESLFALCAAKSLTL